MITELQHCVTVTQNMSYLFNMYGCIYSKSNQDYMNSSE